MAPRIGQLAFRGTSAIVALAIFATLALAQSPKERRARIALRQPATDDEREALPTVVESTPRRTTPATDANDQPTRFESLGEEEPDADVGPCRLPAIEIDAASDGDFVEGAVDPRCRIDVAVGQARVIVFREPPRRVYQPSEEHFEHQIISPTEISVVGLSPGRGTLMFWMKDPDSATGVRILSYEVVVASDRRVDRQVKRQARESLEDRYRALEREINQAFPDSRVSLSLVGDQLLVRGQAKDSMEATQILGVAARHRPRRRDDAVDNSAVLPAGATVGIRETSATETGFVETTIETSANRQDRDENPQGIVNLLEIPGEQQVMLRVTVAEVNRTALRSIGLNFGVRNDAGTTVFSSLVGNLSASGGNLPVSLDNGQVTLAINALRSLRLARTLAEPNLTALNGHTARFQAGGRFPVPVVSGFTNRGLQGVAFIPFGVQVQFTPYIVDRDRVRLQVGAEVSTRDEALGTAVGGSSLAGGTQVSGLNTRNFNTTVELREGQTLAVAGLIQSNFGAQSDRVPLWGDLPLIGHTGGFNRVSSGEQELVILVTPELVSPLKACETPPAPGFDVFEPTDVEFYLGNRLESRRTQDYRASVRTDYRRIRNGDIYCESRFLVGAAGPSYGCCPRPDGRCSPASSATGSITTGPSATGSGAIIAADGAQLSEPPAPPVEAAALPATLPPIVRRSSKATRR